MTKKQKHPEKSGESLIIVGPLPFPVSVLKDFISDPLVRLIYIDGGYRHAEKFRKKTPHLFKKATLMGDGDSSKKMMTLKKTSQNISDLAFCLSKLSGKSAPARCLLVGFLGGRLDHALTNLGEVSLYLNQFKKFNAPLIQMDKKIIFMGPGIHYIEIHGVFSVAAIEANKIKLTGECAFKAPSWLAMAPLSSRGVSNIGHGEIRIETKKAVAILKN